MQGKVMFWKRRENFKKGLWIGYHTNQGVISATHYTTVEPLCRSHCLSANYSRRSFGLQK
ncbi:hypothetical protein Mapa_014311 [Marchantia paleacea]|nr:hypothetical protein Mapa_014311 [Marchantia paleacea]